MVGRKNFNFESQVRFLYLLFQGLAKHPGDTMTIQEKLEFHRQLDETLQKKADEISEEITKFIKAFFKKKHPNENTWDKLYRGIINLMYISFKQTCVFTVEEITNFYYVEIEGFNNFEDNDIEKYVYNEDNLTPKDRVRRLIDKMRENFPEQEASKDIIEEIFIFSILRILDNETLTISHKLTKAIIKAGNRKIEYAMIISGKGCNRECCNQEESYWAPIDELTEPPYHPNCTCEIIYSDPEDDDEEE